MSSSSISAPGGLKFGAFGTVLASLLGLSAATSFAQSVKDAYLQDQRGGVVRNTHFGEAKIGNLCWRTGYWTPALAIAECDQDIAPRPAPVPKPAAAPAAAPTAPATPPAAPTAAPAAPRKCDFSETLDADATFEFNQSQLRAGARAKLDAIASRAAGPDRVPGTESPGHDRRARQRQVRQELTAPCCRRCASIRTRTWIDVVAQRPDGIN